MQSYSDFYKDLMSIIKSSVEQTFENMQGNMFVEVVSTDGYYAVVKPVSGDKNISPISNVPIMQSPYYAPITMPGDFGICLNTNVDVGQFLKGGRERGSVRNKAFYVFVPLLKKEAYKASNAIAVLSSADLESKVEMSNDALTISHSKDFSVDVKGTTGITSGGDISISTQSNASINAQSNITAEGAEVSISAQSAINVEGAQISITAQSPVEIAGSGGSLGDAFQSVFDCLNGVASGMTGPSTNPASLMAQLPAAIAKVKMIVK